MGRVVQPIQLDMEFADQGGEGATPYEVLLHAAMTGQTLRFTRQDTVEEQWRIMQPLLDAPPPVRALRARLVGTRRRRKARRRPRPLVRALDTMSDTDHPDRLPGLELDAMADEARRLLGVTVTRVAADEAGGGGPPRTKPLHILTVIAHHPTFLGPFIDWATALAQHGLSRTTSRRSSRCASPCSADPSSSGVTTSSTRARPA